MKIEFSKMSGAGNDFVCVDNRTSVISNGARLARVLCNRRSGVGADGLLLLEPSDRADFKMMYYNADGSFGGMCGNGGRCIAVFGMKQNAAKPRMQFEALDHVYDADVSEDRVTLTMKDVGPLSRKKMMKIRGNLLHYYFIDTGSPHVVIPLDFWGSTPRSLESVQVESIGRTIREHNSFAPDGTNVNFIKLSKDRTVHFRTYERGVEAETFACGTGSIAAAFVAHKIWKLNSPIQIIPRSSIPLLVEFRQVGQRYEKVRLTGPAIITFTGTVDVET
jgi:diaminopimelate epimerase